MAPFTGLIDTSRRCFLDSAAHVPVYAALLDFVTPSNVSIILRKPDLIHLKPTLVYTFGFD